MALLGGRAPALSDKDICPAASDSAVSVPQQRQKPQAPVADVHYVGTVTMAVSLSDVGRICDVRIIKGIEPALNKEAVDALRQQVFQPIRRNGEPIPGVMVVQRDFWRGDTSDFLIAQTANASSDDIAADARSFVALGVAQVAATGKVQNEEYVNEYFGMSFTAPGASFTAPSGIDDQGKNARLVDAVGRSARRDDLFTISAVADRLSNYPELKSRSDYVNMVSTALEHEGAKRTRGDFPFVISGIEFTGAVFEESDGPGLSHSRGIFATAMKGFMLSLDIAAPTEDKVVKLASSIRFRMQPVSNH